MSLLGGQLMRCELHGSQLHVSSSGGWQCRRCIYGPTLGWRQLADHCNLQADQLEASEQRGKLF